MKLTDFTKVIVLGLILTLGAPGCRKHPGQITPLPGRTGSNVPEAGTAPPISDTGTIKAETTGGFSQTDPNIRKNWPRDREIFKSDIVHFDYDSSSVKGQEKAKVSAVADYLKANSMDAVEIE